MKVKDRTVYFKSDGPMYVKEQIGVKCNTVRLLSENERNLILWNDIDRIHMDHRQSSARFEREISDITFAGKFLGSYITIFSWLNDRGETR